MHPRSIWRELFTPSLMGSFGYTLAAVLILVGSNVTSLVYKLTTPDNQYYFSRLFHDYASATFGKINENQTIGQITLFLVWASVGAAIYVVLWLGINIYVALHNDIVVGTSYTSVAVHGHAAYWAETTGRGLFRVCALLLLFLLVSITTQIWYPLSILMFRIWADNFYLLANWGLLLEAFLGWCVVLHVVVILLRLALLRTRIFA